MSCWHGSPSRTVTVLEREPVTGFHQTGHNSGVLHAGIYYAPGSLKARLCTEGAPELLEYCQERGIPARQDGKLIVALSEEERPRLDELERRGRANGVPGLRRLRPEEIAEIEPHVRGVDALHSPATAVVDFRAVAEAFADDVRERRRRGRHRLRRRARRRATPAGSASATPRARAGRASPCSAPAAGRTGSRSRPAATPTRASSPSAAPGCVCGPSAATSCARSSTRCPTPRCRSSASTSPAAPTTRS